MEVLPRPGDEVVVEVLRPSGGGGDTPFFMIGISSCWISSISSRAKRLDTYKEGTGKDV